METVDTALDAAGGAVGNGPDRQVPDTEADPGAGSAAAGEWDRIVDVLVVGSGAAALTAAITAADDGLDVLVVESTRLWGGTTAISGGGLWMPDNPLMKKAGVQDSLQNALTYMEEVIADVGPVSSRERKLAFLQSIPEVVTFLGGLGVQWMRSKDYPDYYPDRPGGMVGRSLEVRAFDTKLLGPWFKQSRAAASGIPAPLATDDVWELSRAWSTPSGFVRGARFVFRTLGGLLRGKRLYGLGGALSSSLMYIVRNQQTPVWLSAPLTDLIQDDDGAVLGAVVRRQGRDVRIKARRGVVLGAGGFARNAAWREKYQGLEKEYSSAPEGDLGQAIDIVAARGGALALMDDAWWGPTAVGPKGKVTFTLAERSMPFSLVVDAAGKRFLNESESYVDFGHHMLENNKKVPGDPAWLVFESRHARRYLFNALLQGRREWQRQGLLVRDGTLAGLAGKMGVPPAALEATVERFNGFARTGIDEDFHRGDTVYDNYYSDPRVKPNPNLGPLEQGPFSAVRLYPGDLGTKGGLVTDADARVLREDGSVIPGLYAAGNTTASVMGRTYPGAGATIAPAVVFGYRAARHAAAYGAAAAGTAAAPAVAAAAPAELPVQATAG
ncbi:MULTISPECIES: FAD-binding protein [unclassified Arthrobacter]|uniref:FAD-binding protein n=1 Tax=unclassified Arthrobacter TaxID=235627 RepID=UPI001E32F6BE|nr:MULTISPECIES: FAD-binding protein [unclassified Arthrobacter]MCC9144723.1 FAD-dependent oxidoreductase [Arthrobacter sp. zg-Y919]MDK1275949.1 FAD-dependent oxidoreductase [Arthrobacter sp. zg.Y919]WIB02699.1 FAD-dependent oxidoreductase [Arthrobacter sp. zg-Y919]